MNTYLRNQNLRDAFAVFRTGIYENNLWAGGGATRGRDSYPGGGKKIADGAGSPKVGAESEGN